MSGGSGNDTIFVSADRSGFNTVSGGAGDDSVSISADNSLIDLGDGHETVTVEAALTDFGIRDCFEIVVVSADVGWRKPHPEIFRETLRRMRLDARQAVFVGDTPDADVAGPQNIGMDTIWIDRGTTTLPADASPPTYTVSSFAEVARLL